MSELRIQATYAATDGSMPEQIEVVWDDAPSTADVVAVIESLAALPGKVRAQ